MKQMPMPRYIRVEPLTPPSPGKATWLRSGIFMSASPPKAGVERTRRTKAQNHDLIFNIPFSLPDCGKIVREIANLFVRLFWVRRKYRQKSFECNQEKPPFHPSLARFDGVGTARGGKTIHSPRFGRSLLQPNQIRIVGRELVVLMVIRRLGRERARIGPGTTLDMAIGKSDDPSALVLGGGKIKKTVGSVVFVNDAEVRPAQARGINILKSEQMRRPDVSHVRVFPVNPVVTRLIGRCIPIGQSTVPRPGPARVGIERVTPHARPIHAHQPHRATGFTGN